MSLNLRWVGESEMAGVAEVRLRCYAHALNLSQRFHDSISADRRFVGNPFLLAEQDGRAIGTATSLLLRMWVRGTPMDCQGIAYVGTIKTHRRGSRGPGGGVASQLMWEAIRSAREQRLAATSLMPFRASFYEHFGYGTVESRHHWQIPLTVLPTGDFGSIRFYEPADRVALEAARQRSVVRGQCDIERPSHYWDIILQKAEEGFVIVDRPDANGPILGYLWLQYARENGTELLKVMDGAFEDIQSLRRQFHFLASLKDQYSAVQYPLPVDLPVHWLLKEVQLPHRPVTHSVASVSGVNRLQVRILDHARFIEPMLLPPGLSGKAIIAVRETEGHISKFQLDVAAGKATVTPSEASADFDCTDRIWAPIVCGELPAGQAVKLGLAEQRTETASKFLSLFAHGPRPFCTEGF